jgi:hypothetical protein
VIELSEKKAAEEAAAKNAKAWKTKHKPKKKIVEYDEEEPQAYDDENEEGVAEPESKEEEAVEAQTEEEAVEVAA